MSRKNLQFEIFGIIYTPTKKRTEKTLKILPLWNAVFLFCLARPSQEEDVHMTEKRAII